ncbi:MAG: Fic family protein [Eubacteriales bacterium]|nr:Fic family protein [Eubacteriales bacterium]
MIKYDGLNNELKKRNIGKTDLTDKLGLSSRTVAKISKNEKLSIRTLRKIADYLGVNAESLFKEVSDNKILQALREEKEAKLSGGIYHELQVRMTYNSNHIEGSRLSEAQTRLIFETNTIDMGEGIPVDDILETLHHFRAIDYCIDHAEDELSEQIIKELHYILKHDTKDSELSWFAVGDYKKRANVVGGKETSKPSEVGEHIKALLKDYNSKAGITISDIIAFHARFEQIHPFQDGNGRVGRLIALKECLRHNIIPFIIEDSKKGFYYRGLSEWREEKGWLTDTCLDGQDTFIRLLDMLEISYYENDSSGCGNHMRQPSDEN